MDITYPNDYQAPDDVAGEASGLGAARLLEREQRIRHASLAQQLGNGARAHRDSPPTSAAIPCAAWVC